MNGFGGVNVSSTGAVLKNWSSFCMLGVWPEHRRWGVEPYRRECTLFGMHITITAEKE